MGSKGKSNKIRETYQFPRSTHDAPDPPGGWPSTGSGYEPDPFGPAGSWLQSVTLIDAMGRRVNRKIAVPVAMLLVVLILLGILG